eukprot:TRINITY_DN9115_c0_g1_i3.p1 TRINITY_DN9115_c0_g1~~TRINITY_DN9115_c0_g1_i3.p1  ORF type:complete len:110 (-),score=15.94 TRINITY_DN9115_c0_g1_i3:71-400(-)
MVSMKSSILCTALAGMFVQAGRRQSVAETKRKKEDCKPFSAAFPNIPFDGIIEAFAIEYILPKMDFPDRISEDLDYCHRRSASPPLQGATDRRRPACAAPSPQWKQNPA